MLEEACKALRRWLDEGKQVVPLSVNQSRLHMFNPQYLQKIVNVNEKVYQSLSNLFTILLVR